MKKGIKILSWSAFTLVVLILLVLVDYSYSAIPCRGAEVNITQEGGHHFITKESVLEQLSAIGYPLTNQVYKEIEAERIEQEIKQTAGVKSAEVVKLNNGTVVLDIVQSRPIARIVNSNGLVSFYLDEDGNTMPLSKTYIAKVPVFSGDIYYVNNNVPSVSKIKENDSLKAVHILDDIYAVALAIDKNDFVKAQVLQVLVTPKVEFEMIPRVGRNRIMLGDTENIELKIKRLNRFYTEVINPKELNNYDTISLKYQNQIVCSKR